MNESILAQHGYTWNINYKFLPDNRIHVTIEFEGKIHELKTSSLLQLGRFLMAVEEVITESVLYDVLQKEVKE